MEKIKILFVIYYLHSGGAEKALITLLNHFDYVRYEVTLLMFKKEGLYLDMLNKNVNIITLEGYENIESLRSFSKYSIKHKQIMNVIKLSGYYLNKKLSKKNIDWANWRFRFNPNIKNNDKHYDIAVAYMQGIPTWYVTHKVVATVKIAWVHNFFSKLNLDRNFESLCYKKLNYIVSISPECVKNLKENFPEFNDKFILLYNLVDDNNIKNLAQLGKGYDDNFMGPRLLTIGSLTPQKGYDLAIKACKILKNKGITFKWYALGKGKLKNELENMIIKNDVQDCFILLGITPNPYPYIKQADIYVQTSIFEGKSIALDEAKVLSKPILVTKYPSVEDQIIDGFNGIIVNIDENSIADGLEKLLMNEGLRSELVKNLDNTQMDNQIFGELDKHYALFEKDL